MKMNGTNEMKSLHDDGEIELLTSRRKEHGDLRGPRSNGVSYTYLLTTQALDMHDTVNNGHQRQLDPESLDLTGFDLG